MYCSYEYAHAHIFIHQEAEMVLGINEFAVVFENPKKIYGPGEKVKGKVFFVSTSNLALLGLHVVWSGQAEVKFNEGDSIPIWSTDKRKFEREDTEVTCTSNDFFFQNDLWVFGKATAKKGEEFHPGKHEYHFEFIIPDSNSNLPSSYEGDWGWVRYEVVATLKMQGKSNLITRGQIHFQAIVDLNEDANAGKPKKITFVEKQCCGSLCRVLLGSVSFTLSIPQAGYAPGEKINYLVEIANRGKDEITSIEIEFVEKATFQTDSASKISHFLIQKLTHEGVGPKSKANWEGSILVPNMPPTDLGGCKIIKVQYYLKCKLNTKDVETNLADDLEIKIGTKPVDPFRSKSAAFRLTRYGPNSVTPDVIGVDGTDGSHTVKRNTMRESAILTGHRKSSTGALVSGVHKEHRNTL